MTYFSDRERGPLPRVNETIPQTAYAGIVIIIDHHIDNGAFGIDFPEDCPDDEGTIGTNTNAFQTALVAEIPNMTWPLNAGNNPEIFVLLDFIEFCYRHVAQPIKGTYHNFFNHHHLGYNRVNGQQEFGNSINRIFARNGIAFELQEDGQIQRLAPPILREALTSVEFQTGDRELDILLASARSKFLSPNQQVRKESLEKLWDAWERLKTINVGVNKKTSLTQLLDKAAPEATFRKTLENESRELTVIGNTFLIRHTETTQIPLQTNSQVDYLFHRLFALIHLILSNR